VKEQIIRLEPDDDVTSVRDKLGWIRAPRVLLVFPDDPRQPVLQRKLDLVLIQREATRRRAQLALITHDPVIAEHAGELGIACFRSLEASRKRYWRTARARLSVERAERPTQLDTELVEAGTRLRPAPKGLSAAIQRAAAGSIVALIVIGVLIGLYLVLPGATVQLTPAANQVTVTTSVTADPGAAEVDTVNGIIPARTVGVEVESSAMIDTTGTIEEPTEKARGVALFTNLIRDQVTIPAGTIVRTSAAQPVRFVTLADVTLAGDIGETVEAPIEALEPGYEGNLPSNRINKVEGALEPRLGVTNPEPTRGGDVTEVPAISREDRERVRALVLQQLQQRAYAEMQTNPYVDLEETEFIPHESLGVALIHSEDYLGHTGSETFEGYIDQPAEKVSLTLRATVQGVAIDEQLARQVAYAKLADKVGSGYQIGSGSLIFRRGEATGVDGQGRVTFIMQGAGDVSMAIRPEEVQAMVRGKPVDDALAHLDRELPLSAPPVIETWPPFWPLMPSLPLRIRVEVSGQP
jgi:hypothetical protein